MISRLPICDPLICAWICRTDYTANTRSRSCPVKVQVHCRRKDDGNARLIGPALYRWLLNRPGFSRIDYAKPASRRCAVQVFHWSACSSYIHDRNRITHGFLSSTRPARFVPEEWQIGGDFSASLFRFRDGRKRVAVNEACRLPMRPAAIDELDVGREWKYSLAFLRERPAGLIPRNW